MQSSNSPCRDGALPGCNGEALPKATRTGGDATDDCPSVGVVHDDDESVTCYVEAADRGHASEHRDSPLWRAVKPDR